MSSTASRCSLPSSVTISVPSPYHLRLIPAARELAPDQVRCPPPAAARPRRRLALLLPPGRQVLLAHQVSDSVLADFSAGVFEVSGDPRGSALAPVRIEQPPDLGFEPLTASCPRRQLAAGPLVEPRLGHAQ